MPTEKEMIADLIDRYQDLQRLKSAPDKEKELENQIRFTKAKLESCGVNVENLIIE